MKRFCSTRWFLLAGIVAAFVGATIVAARSSSAMATVATRFLGSLTPELRQQASFGFDSDERLKWHFIPTGSPGGFPRHGLTIKAMSASQRRLAHDLFKAGLSQRGYLTATGIMDLETVLGALEADQRSATPSLPAVFIAIRSSTFFPCSAYRRRTAPGDGAWKGTTSRFISRW